MPGPSSTTWTETVRGVDSTETVTVGAAESLCSTAFWSRFENTAETASVAITYSSDGTSTSKVAASCVDCTSSTSLSTTVETSIGAGECRPENTSHSCFTSSMSDAIASLRRSIGSRYVSSASDRWASRFVYPWITCVAFNTLCRR